MRFVAISILLATASAIHIDSKYRPPKYEEDIAKEATPKESKPVVEEDVETTAESITEAENQLKRKMATPVSEPVERTQPSALFQASQ